MVLVVAPSLYGRKIFRLYGNNPLISLPPALPAKRGEQGGYGRRGVGGRRSHLPTPLFPCFPLPTLLCSAGRGPGGEAISQWIGRLSNYPVGAKNLSPQAETTFAWLLVHQGHEETRRFFLRVPS